MKQFWLMALAVLLSPPALAQEVGECDWRASAQAMAEPWQENTRIFANGKTRLALMDVIEPAAGAFYLLVLSPPFDELGGRQCRIIGMGNGVGFSGVNFSELQAQYDPAKGLQFTLPVTYYDGSTAGFVARTLNMTLNQATGDIGTDLR